METNREKYRSMTRIEATDCIDTIRTAIRKCTAEPM